MRSRVTEQSASLERAVLSFLVALPASILGSVIVAFYSGWVTYGAGRPPAIAAALLPFLLVWSKSKGVFGSEVAAFAAGCAAQLVAFFVITYGVVELWAYIKSRRQRRDA